MTYSAFVQHVLVFFKKELDDAAEISIQKVTKNNNVILDGLIILENGINISPTLYLNYFYEQLQSGTSLETVLNQLMQLYQTSKPKENMDVSFFTDYTKVSGKLFYKLINASQNEALLPDIPHIRFLDLAITFYCLVTCGSHGSATILIRNQHLSLWNITKDTLYHCAAQNTARQMPPKLLDMNDLLSELAPGLLSDAPDIASPMYILTNEKKLYGAASLLNTALLKNFALKKHSDFYILPSSVHEVLLLPTSDQPQPDELNKMVQEVNETQLSREEVLSDHVYYYSLSEESIKILS